MKSIISLSVFLLWLATHACGQMGFVATGGDCSGGGGLSNFSIGQIDYITGTGIGGIANQGNQQPYEMFSVVAVSDADWAGIISVYPNPTTDILVLAATGQNLEGLVYGFYDMHGRLLLNGAMADGKASISLASFAQSTYLLIVQQNGTEVKSFKIVKRQ